ncbi:DUF6924 domain-containing protein [Phytohabitans houttuyneae]|uniref:DUF6924 domain-containing protein n=1 Tax=Phytohabitans houttuyneae TaxID=1076126 RepID=A0A6V8KMR3_9ACTN|nr:hypothetical protein [Phytohabitans houttuyneae]GFJ83256.1 hypothetical protein Phou_074360 [Phytohabitans houttuyneae]
MLPTIERGEDDEFIALVVRVDYTDDAAWRTVVDRLDGDEDWTVDAQVVDDPAYAGSTVDEVLAAVSGDKMLRVLFVADAATMRDPYPLIAVSTLTREACLDEEQFAEEMRFGREFRLTPAAVAEVHGNLAIANMGFDEFAEAAAGDPERIHRGFAAD